MPTIIETRQSSVREIVARMSAYTLELRSAEIKLNQNESPFDFPRELKDEVLATMAAREWNVYPDFEAIALRTALAEAYDLTPENTLAGNGSNELLAAAIGTFVGAGTPVIFPRPTFTLYEKLIAIAGGLALPIDFDPASGLLPLDEMLRAIESHENPIVIVCSPNNPTGGMLPSDGLERLLATGAVVLFDRAYGDFAIDSLSPLHPRLVTFSTFSKAWGLASLRLGWLASTANNCREIRKVKLPYSLNVMSAETAVVALRNRAYRDRNVAAIVAERERVVTAMATIPRIAIFPTSANFVAFRPEVNCKVLFEALCAAGILIRDVSAYPRMQNCLRVSIGTHEQNDRFIEQLRRNV